MDNEKWVPIGSYTGTDAQTDSIDLELDGPEARYVRLVNKADIKNGCSSPSLAWGHSSQRRSIIQM